MTQHIFCLGPYMGGPYLLRQGRTFSGLLLEGPENPKADLVRRVSLLRLAARMGIQLRSRATPAARRSSSKAVPSRRVRGDASVGLRPVASAFGSRLCNSWLDICCAGLCARRLARGLRSRKANEMQHG